MKKILPLLLLFTALCAAAPAEEPQNHISGNGTWFKFQGGYYLASPTPNSSGAVTVNGNPTYILTYRTNNGLGKAFRADGSFLWCECSIEIPGDLKMFGTKNFGDFVLYDNGWTDITAQQAALPKFTVISISNSTTGDRDGDGVPDGDDPDPDNPDKDGDGKPDGDDCNPDDPSNTMTKPNCYRCDDGSAVASSADCPGDEGGGGSGDDDDDDDEEKSDWLKWGEDKKFSATAFALKFLDKLTTESLPDENKIVLEIPCNTINLGGGSYFNFGGWKIYFEKEVAPYVTVDDNPEFMFCLTGDHPADGMAFWKKCRTMLYQAWKIVFFLYFAVATYHRYCEL